MSSDDRLKEILETPALSDDEVRASARFCAEACYLLLKPRKDWVAERRGLMKLVNCTWNYLKEMGAGRDELDRLAAYSIALGDLDDGVVHPMFKVNNGNAAIGSQGWLLRGLCAVAHDYLMAAGDPREDAAKQVARILGFEKLSRGRAKETEPYKAVLTWRKTAKKGKDLDEMFQKVWKARIPPGSVSKLEFRKASADQIRILRHELGAIEGDL